MSTEAICYSIAGILVLPGAAFVAVRAYATRRPSEAERVAAARERVGMPAADSYTGPDPLLLMQDTDRYLDTVALTDRELAPRFGPGAVKPDPRQLEER